MIHRNFYDSIPYLIVGFPAQRANNVKSVSKSCTTNKSVDYSDIVGATPVSAAPTTSSFSNRHLASKDCANTTARRVEKHFSFGIWCNLYWRFACTHQHSAAWPQKKGIWIHRFSGSQSEPDLATHSSNVCKNNENKWKNLLHCNWISTFILIGISHALISLNKSGQKGHVSPYNHTTC